MDKTVEDKEKDNAKSGSKAEEQIEHQDDKSRKETEREDACQELASQVAELNSQLEASRKELMKVSGERDVWISKAVALNDQYIRAKEDFDKFRKRLERDFEERLTREKGEFILPILEVLDNFERALKAADEDKSSGNTGLDALRRGVVMIQAQIVEVLRREGVEPIESSVGKRMDPEFHEAVATQEAGGEHGTVVEQLQTGYMYKGTVLRPSKVKVIK